MFKKFAKICVDSISAGIMISVGVIIYLNCSNKIVGAFLFSLGLLTIMAFGFNLYTGKVGNVRKPKDIPYILTVLIMNAVGCLLMFTFPTNGAADVMAAKLACPLGYVFGKAIVCGLIIYICVEQKKKPYFTIIGIPAFILCGAEHSIADICFVFASRHVSWQEIGFLLVVALGNAVGAIIPSIWLEKRSLLDDNKQK